jgi:acyl-CoA synthetase (NDP forming)
VALKILSAEAAHKSDAGGVVLGVKDVRGLRENALNIGKATGKPVSEVLVQRMEQGLAEAIVGYRDDPVVGPLVMVGAGGILAELYNDVVLRLAPVDEAEANPVLVKSRGVVAEDALVVLKEEKREE